MRDKINKFLTNSMYKNSFYLMINLGIMSILGFIFWTLATRYYNVEQIGLASTLISLMNLIMIFSMLGFNMSLIKFLPQSNRKEEKIWSCFWISSFIAVIISILFLLITKSVYPQVGIIRENLLYSLLFIVFAVFLILFNLIESVFIAYRKSELVLIKNTIWSILKIIMLFVFISLGAYGIFIGWYSTLIISFFISLFFLKIGFKLKINQKAIKKMFNFSAGNYFSTIFAALPGIGLPLFITYYLGINQTAYFYISWMIANLLFFIPQAIGRSYLSEISHKKNNNNVKEALKLNYIIILIGLGIGILFSKSI